MLSGLEVFQVENFFGVLSESMIRAFSENGHPDPVDCGKRLT